MNFKRKKSNENLCPVEIKRPKLFKTFKSNNNLGQSPTKLFLKESNNNMIESNDTTAGNTNRRTATDENSNEQTPVITAPVLLHNNLERNYDFHNRTIESDHNESECETSTQKYRSNINKDVTIDKKSKNLNIQCGKRRSPLAAVCNNQNEQINQKLSTLNVAPVTSTVVSANPSTSSSLGNFVTEGVSELNLASQQKPEDLSQNRKAFIPHENFFLYRLKDRSNMNMKNPFKTLSDEMILQIFKWLPKKALIRCSFVCSRFSRVAQDESLWTRLDLGNKSLKSGALGNVVSRGIVILRLAQADIADPIFDPERIDFFNEFESKLQYLDLSMAVISKPSLKALLSKCKNLKKLSLEHISINDGICDEIAKNINLEALNLAMSDGLEQWSVTKIFKDLQRLHSLNISWASLSIESITALVQNLTPNILRLNIAGCRKNIFDSHVAVLSKRCRDLVELDLSDCTGLTSATIHTLCKFRDLEYLSLSRCYGINSSSYIDLKNLKSLAYLDVFGILQESAMITLQNAFPTVGINKFIHSTVARPTVGSRRTSIWGLRTRD